MSAWVWLVLGIGLCVAEAMTGTLVLGFVGVGALAAAAADALGADGLVELLVFVIASGLGLVVVRPLARRQDRRESMVGLPESLHGQHAVVVQEVGAHAGQVRFNGELWAARSLDPSTPIPVGANVVVATVKGATVEVYPSTLI